MHPYALLRILTHSLAIANAQQPAILELSKYHHLKAMILHYFLIPIHIMYASSGCLMWEIRVKIAIYPQWPKLLAYMCDQNGATDKLYNVCIGHTLIRIHVHSYPLLRTLTHSLWIENTQQPGTLELSKYHHLKAIDELYNVCISHALDIWLLDAYALLRILTHSLDIANAQQPGILQLCKYHHLKAIDELYNVCICHALIRTHTHSYAFLRIPFQ